MIIRDRDLLNDDGSVPIKLLNKCIQEHIEMTTRLEMLKNYYDGEHAILKRTLSNTKLPNNKIICNHAQYISDMATGYVFGTPISYSGNENKNNGVDELNKIFTQIDEDSHNNELALDISIYGYGYELIYMNNDEVPYPELAVISPHNTFLVVDSTVKHKPMFAVNYYEKKDIEGTVLGYYVNIYTESEIYYYFFNDLTSTAPQELDLEEHYFGDIPVIEYWNNKKSTGDFEGVISLIDAYNLLQSDRLNDKEQLVDAILAVINASFGDSENELTETERFLKEHKILELPRDADAKWLTKQLNETEIEVLKKSLKDDIHEFSKVPCLTDENFVGNASGIAMKYKLLGFEQLGKTKERYFKKGLRQRLKLISNIKNIQARNINPDEIDITMKRSLPVDDELQARIAQETDGFISWETRVKRFDEELDVAAERERLDKENQNKLEQQQKAFGSYDFKNTSNTKEDVLNE